MINLAQKPIIRRINPLGWVSPLSFVLEITEDYGVFKARDKAIFVPIEMGYKSPKTGSIIIVNDRIGLFDKREFTPFCYLYSLDDSSLIFYWNKKDENYRINGLFIGILKELTSA